MSKATTHRGHSIALPPEIDGTGLPAQARHVLREIPVELERTYSSNENVEFLAFHEPAVSGRIEFELPAGTVVSDRKIRSIVSDSCLEFEKLLVHQKGDIRVTLSY